MSGGVLRAEREGSVMVLTLDRPEELNAINRQTLPQLASHLDDAERDPDARVLVVSRGVWGGQRILRGRGCRRRHRFHPADRPHA